MGINDFIQIGSTIKELELKEFAKEMSKLLDIPYSTYQIMKIITESQAPT